MKYFCIFLGVLLLSVSEVRCWGQEGHSIVADIAQSLLTSKSLKAVHKLIPGELMDEISSVPDDYDHTDAGRWSGPLHYVNLKRQNKYFSYKDCNNSCVVTAIQNYTKLLQANPEGLFQPSPYAEPSPFIFLVHFIGDIQQPLHVSYGDDEGGNLVNVTFYGNQTELHAVWDVAMILKYNPDLPSFSEELIATISNNKSIIAQYTESMDPADWANESFSLVRTDVYVGVTGNDAALGEKYYKKNIPIVKQRLMAGGIRLGTLLNSILDPTFSL